MYSPFVYHNHRKSALDDAAWVETQGSLSLPIGVDSLLHYVSRAWSLFQERVDGRMQIPADRLLLLRAAVVKRPQTSLSSIIRLGSIVQKTDDYETKYARYKEATRKRDRKYRAVDDHHSLTAEQQTHRRARMPPRQRLLELKLTKKDLDHEHQELVEEYKAEGQDWASLANDTQKIPTFDAHISRSPVAATIVKSTGSEKVNYIINMVWA